MLLYLFYKTLYIFYLFYNNYYYMYHNNNLFMTTLTPSTPIIHPSRHVRESDEELRTVESLESLHMSATINQSIGMTVCEENQMYSCQYLSHVISYKLL
jgi:hypothetical protein